LFVVRFNFEKQKRYLLKTENSTGGILLPQQAPSA